MVANALFYLLASALVAYHPGFLRLANVSGAVIFTVVPAMVAVLLYAARLRFTHHPATIFSAVVASVFVVTLIPDLTYIPTVPGSSAQQTATLVLMHVIAAGVIVRLLTASAHPLCAQPRNNAITTPAVGINRRSPGPPVYSSTRE